MDIINPTPIIVPQKQYDQMYVTNINIIASPDSPWNVSIVGVPYDGESDILESQKTIITMKDIKALAPLDAELAQATSVMLAVIAKYLVKAKQKNVKVITTQNVLQVLE